MERSVVIKRVYFVGGRGELIRFFSMILNWGGGTLCRIVFYIYFSTVLYVVNIAL